MTSRTDEDASGDDEHRDHVDDLDDGCGCVEVWEALYEQRTDSDAG